jgi:alkanesulfonate monooxygenase SsuD/methylene tetrahydromethanopterin reductase-like flavin-dependent oxidoreductase (luciferase family)
MRFGNFLFPTVDDPADDGRFIDETIAEARLSDRLGMDAVWLAEHHFDGMCAYVDPVTFSTALAVATEHIKIGYSVAQMALHHPVRLAEQVALIDHLSKGRLIVGLGRGPTTNTYEYDGFGIPFDEAQPRMVEAEELMIKAWTASGTNEEVRHEGRFWNVKIPELRPRPFTRPHPPVIRACSSEGSVLDQARAGRPFLMNIQPLEVTQQRMDAYRACMRDAGYDEQRIAENCRQSWVWRNIFVAETDDEAANVGIPAYQRQSELRDAMRNRMFEEQGSVIEGVTRETVAALPRRNVEAALIHGSPDTVAEKIAAIDATGAGGVIASFRIGPMPVPTATSNLELFMTRVAPHFRDATTP